MLAFARPWRRRHYARGDSEVEPRGAPAEAGGPLNARWQCLPSQAPHCSGVALLVAVRVAARPRVVLAALCTRVLEAAVGGGATLALEIEVTAYVLRALDPVAAVLGRAVAGPAVVRLLPPLVARVVAAFAAPAASASFALPIALAAFAALEVADLCLLVG